MNRRWRCIRSFRKLVSANLLTSWPKYVVERILQEIRTYYCISIILTFVVDGCICISSQMALAYHNMRDVDVAVDAFKNLLELDPFRLENMDSYSNLLYVKAVRFVDYRLESLAFPCKLNFPNSVETRPSDPNSAFLLIGWLTSTNIAWKPVASSEIIIHCAANIKRCGHDQRST